MQKYICLFRSWNNLPRTQNFKPKFEFQTSLARISPVGTSELLPFGANSDLPWDWRFPDILLRDSSLLFHFGVYYDSTFLGTYINHQKDKIYYVPLNPVADYVYISYLILDSVLSEKRYITKFLIQNLPCHPG